MQFTNITPDTSPSGGAIPPQNGTRYFYFLFVAPSTSVDFYFARNRYRNEEYITRLYTETSDVSLLNSIYVRNITFPTTFFNGYLGLSTPSGAIYINNTTIPNCRIVNLVQGAVYYIESRTIYNDPGVDFGLIIKSGIGSVPLQYMRTELTSIPLPLPPPSPSPLPLPPLPLPSPDGVPIPPTNIVSSSGAFGAVLTWVESVGATLYNVYRSYMFIGRTASTKFIDPYVVSGGTYLYTITASNTNGESVPSLPITVTPLFMFTNLLPDRTPAGVALTGIGIRYYYFLFTTLTSSLDAFVHFNGIVNQSAIIGLYSTLDTNTNLLNNPNVISNIDTNIVQGNFTLGNPPDPQVTVYGLRMTSTSQYTNTTSIPNFKINNLNPMTTYILEVVCTINYADDSYADLGIYFKNKGGLFDGYTAQIGFNKITLVRTIPNPYIIEYNFASTSVANYSTFIYPNLQVFENAKHILENIIIASPASRSGRSSDMLVNFIVEQLEPGVLGQSGIDNWTNDSTRSPDFPFEQTITFNTNYFINGYFASNANFNGSASVNSVTNIALFNTFLHEMMHGIGIAYLNYTSSNADVGWNQFLINVTENDPWYKGRSTGSAALSTYKVYCKNSNLQCIPIENHYGAGTANSHWDEGNSPTSSIEKRYYSSIYHPALRLELMTGFLNKNDYLTGLTVGALKDYGYVINGNSPYVVSYPYSLIPNAFTDEMVMEQYCSCSNIHGVHKILDNSYSTQLWYSTASAMVKPQLVQEIQPAYQLNFILWN